MQHVAKEHRGHPPEGHHGALRTSQADLRAFITSVHGAAIVEEHQVLVTCRIVNDDVRDWCAEAGVQVIGREQLAKSWPRRTREFIMQRADQIGFLCG